MIKSLKSHEIIKNLKVFKTGVKLTKENEIWSYIEDNNLLESEDYKEFKPE